MSKPEPSTLFEAIKELIEAKINAVPGRPAYFPDFFETDRCKAAEKALQRQCSNLMRISNL